MANHSGIIDSGTFFEIVPNTRKITVPPMYKVIATVGDHLSEQLTFRCPKLIDGHDVAGCARHYLTWKSVNQEVGHDELTLRDTDDEYIYFTWVVRDGLAVAKGLVSFSVHFEDTDPNGLTIYRWSTATCTECEILDSINAVLGAYEAIYVAGNKLVFADYIPVKDKTLVLETNGLIPEGTLKIEKNGIFDVGRYAQADVEVLEDPNLIPENIKHGVDIFGVTGTCKSCTVVPGSINALGAGGNEYVEAEVWFSGISTNGSVELKKDSLYTANKSNNIDQIVTDFIKDTVVVIRYDIAKKLSDHEITFGGSGWEFIASVKVTGEAYDIYLRTLKITSSDHVTISIESSASALG